MNLDETTVSFGGVRVIFQLSSCFYRQPEVQETSHVTFPVCGILATRILYNFCAFSDSLDLLSWHDFCQFRSPEYLPFKEVLV